MASARDLLGKCSPVDLRNPAEEIGFLEVFLESCVTEAKFESISYYTRCRVSSEVCISIAGNRDQFCTTFQVQQT